MMTQKGFAARQTQASLTTYLCPTKPVRPLSPSTKRQDPLNSLKTRRHSCASKLLCLGTSSVSVEKVPNPCFSSPARRCLAKTGSHAASFFRELMPIPEQHTSLCGSGVGCWESNNSTKPKQFGPQYRVWHHPWPWDGGGLCQGHLDPLPQSICLLPHTWNFTAVTHRS